MNEIHKDGFGLNGKTNQDFFHVRSLASTPSGAYRMENASANFDLNQDGAAEVTAVFRVTGTNRVKPDAPIGVQGSITLQKSNSSSTPVIIDYNPDDTLKDVIRRINDSDAGLVAYITHDQQLAIKATTAQDDRRSSFMIRHVEDSGELLTGYTGILASSGRAGAFDFRRLDEISKFRAPMQDITLTPLYHPAGQISVADAMLSNPASIAGGRGEDRSGSGDYDTPGGLANGNNALLIAAALKQNNMMFGKDKNPEEFYNSLISRLGTQSRTARDAFGRKEEDLLALNNMRQSVMGVNLDEEMANMVQYQNAYNASARIISTMDAMLDVIINRMGA